MKYYIMKNKLLNGYLSRKLCRINEDGKFECYGFINGSSGKWEHNEIIERRFRTKDEDYEIYEPDEKEIEEVKFETDDAAYDNFHEHYSPVLTDSKGRKHEEYIYQDYRSLDGYDAEDGFNYNEIWNREDYDYYFDKDNNLLIKKDKIEKDYYIFSVGYVPSKDDCEKMWITPNKYAPEMKNIVCKYDFNKLDLIRDFNNVLEYIEKEKYETFNSINDKIKNDRMPDMSLIIYNETNVNLNGDIKDGRLHITSEVYGDYNSEKHYIFTVEQTNKLFLIIDVDSFVELCRKEKLIGMEQFLEKNGIKPETHCI